MTALLVLGAPEGKGVKRYGYGWLIGVRPVVPDLGPIGG